MITEIKKYLSQNYGFDVFARDNRADMNLSPMIASTYDFWLCSVNGVAFELLALKPSVQIMPTPKQIAIHIATVSRQLNGTPSVFACNRIISYNRLRLLERRIPFIVPGRQLYLPFMNIAMSDSSAQTIKEYDILSVAAQMLLIAYINSPNEGITIDEAASLTGYTRVSIMKAFNELEYFNFAQRDRRTHRLVFRKNRRQLFADARRVMLNPRRRFVSLDALPQGLATVESGTCALSRISMLSPPGYLEVAALSSDFGKCEKMPIVPKESARYRLELWHYPPAFIFKDRIDPISLVLSLANEIDERVQGEVENILEEFKW